MVHDLHNTLLEKNQLYKLWHKHLLSEVVHWLAFLSLSMILASSAVSVIGADAVVLSAQSAVAIDKIPRVVALKIEQKEPAQDHILLKFKKSSVPWTRGDIYRRHKLVEQSEIKQIGVKVVSISSDDTPEEVVARLNAQEKKSIEFAEVDRVIAPSRLTNDPYFVYDYQWHLKKINAPEAWDKTTGSEAVTIAILDTGVDCNHPDLSTLCVAGWNFYDNNNVTVDVYGHGTAVAGDATALTDNGIGVASVCWVCKIMPLRVSDTNGFALSSTIANALIYASDHGVRIANISYRVSTSESVGLAAQYFQSKGKGGVITVASGNEGDFVSSPDNPYMLTVSATDQNDTIASFSVTGNNLDLSAPGVSIISTGYDARNSTSNYVSGTGTSASAPIVAGVSALVLAVNPGLSSTQIQDILQSSADDLGPVGWDPQYGWGRVNALRAVSMACTYSGSSCGLTSTSTSDSTAPTAPTNLVASAPDGSSVYLSWSPSADNVKVVGYTIYRNDAEINNASSTNYADTSVVPGSTYNYYVKAFDGAGNLSMVSNAVVVNVPNVTSASDTSAPTPPTGLSVVASEATRADLTWLASSDEVGVAGYYVYRNNTKIGSSVSVNYSDLTASPGAQYTYTVRAYDPSGNVSQPSSSVTIVMPPPLDVTAPTAPSNLTASAPDYKKVNLAWKASSDSVGIKGYTIYRSGALLSTTTLTSYSDIAVTPNANYTYYVTAYDKAGNVSAPSNTVSITVPSDAPLQDISILSYQVSKKSATTAIITWSTNIPTTGSIAYGTSSTILDTVLSDTNLSQNHSLTLTNLKPATKYYFKINADKDGTVKATTGLSTFRTMTK